METWLFNKSPTNDKNGRELSLVIDIESGLVRGSLVLFSRPNTNPYVIHTSSFDITAREGNTGAKLLSAMLAAVSKVCENMSTEGLKIASTASINIPISKIHIVFSSPWIITKTKTVKSIYQKETLISKSVIVKMLAEERQNLEQQFINEHNSSTESDLIFIEQKIFDIRLNGYQTINFEGKKAFELEVSFAISVGSKSILAYIETAIEKSIRMSKKNIEYHSSLLLQYSALRTIMAGSEDYITIHIHNEISDIIVVKNGLCAAVASFPAGTSVISDVSSSILGQSNEVADSLLALHSKNALHAAEDSRITAIADASIDNWVLHFSKTLETLGPTSSMPRRVYLLANEYYAHFERALQSSSRLLPFEIVPIEKSVLDFSVSYENKEKEDPLMSLYVFALR